MSGKGVLQMIIKSHTQNIIASPKTNPDLKGRKHSKAPKSRNGRPVRSNGSIGEAVGRYERLNVTTVALQEGLYVPTQEELLPVVVDLARRGLSGCLLHLPIDNCQHSVLYSEASVANVTAIFMEVLLQENFRR